jgi:spore coat protein H
MMESKMRSIRALAMGLSLLAVLCLDALAQQAATTNGTNAVLARSAPRRDPCPGTNVFVPGPLRRIRVEIEGKELEQLKRDNRRYARATFFDGETALRDVGVHLKGAAGSFRGLDDRPALTVSFDKFVPGQRWEGLSKIHLNNSVQDGSYLTENICGEMFRQAGVPTPRACNAQVKVNRRDMGIYVLKEGFDKTFLRQYYRSVKGNLYDGGFCRDITEPLDLLTGRGNPDRSELRALVAAARERDLNRRFLKLQELLDLDCFVSFCAMEIMTWDWDGYLLKPNNYKLYWDPDTRKITFFPHGMDQMFWEPDGALQPGFNGLVAQALVETPEGQRRYRERMAELTTNVLRLETITNRISAYAAPIRAAIAENNQQAAKEYDGQVRRIVDLIKARERVLRKAFAAAPQNRSGKP